MTHRNMIGLGLGVLQAGVMAIIIYVAVAAGADRWLTSISLGFATFVLLVMALGSDLRAKRITCGILAFLCVFAAVLIRFA